MNKRWLWIVLVIVVAAVAVWYFVLRPQEETSTTVVDGQISMGTVVRGPFEATVSATGSVRAERTQRLGFRASGTVVEILVDELDIVSAGDVLARLDPVDVRLSLAQAEAALAIAEAQLARTVKESSDSELAMIDAALAAAESAVQTAQAGVDAARASQQRILAGPTAEEIAIASKRVDDSKNALWGAQAQRDAICGSVGGPRFIQADCDQAEASVNRSEISVEIAQLQLEQMRAGVSDADRAAAQAQVNQALGQLASAQAQLRRAQAEAELSRQGVSAEEIAVVQAQVDQAQVGVDIARRRLDDLELRAPADGVVASVNLFVGDTVVAGNPVMTLIDAADYHVVMSIDETDIGQVAVGQEARVTLDAYPETPMTGTVSRIGAVGSDVQGIVVFDVRVDLELGEVTLRPFMTAAVDVIVMRTEDALLVPVRAVRRDAGGRYVEKLVDGQLVRVPIEIGASNGEFSIVRDGLAEGDEVVVGRPSGPLFQFSFGG